MIALATMLVMFSGIIFITTLTFIARCRSLGMDPNVVKPPEAGDVDIIYTCKLTGFVFVVSLGILYELLAAHPFIHLGT
jgi:hypothetical protein